MGRRLFGLLDRARHAQSVGAHEGSGCMLRAHEEIRFNWLRANGELFAGTVEASTTKQQDSNGELAIVCVSYVDAMEI
jgi:hypothetical protein